MARDLNMKTAITLDFNYKFTDYDFEKFKQIISRHPETDVSYFLYFCHPSPAQIEEIMMMKN